MTTTNPRRPAVRFPAPLEFQDRRRGPFAGHLIGTIAVIVLVLIAVTGAKAFALLTVAVVAVAAVGVAGFRTIAAAARR